MHSAEAIIGLTSNNFVKDVTPAKYDSANDTTMVTGGKIPYEEFLASYQAQPVRTMAVAAPIPTN
ncbi:MAG TPA: hypothetical protein VE973_02870 [Candidatus Limnocylindria bacterium]|nr:hypothetical protein [Candidatus Limnocylindria bacterium]